MRTGIPYLPSAGFVDGALSSLDEIKVNVEPPFRRFLGFRRDLADHMFIELRKAEPEYQ